jgi:YHS domain-containing protein
MQKLSVGILPLLAGLMTVFWLAAAVQAQPPATVFPTQPPPTTSGGSGMALLNLDNTVALHGYDPVAYFTGKRPVPGNKRIIERLGGATYYFVSRSNRYTFLENAPQYQPQVGGYCVTSMSRGRLEDINPEKFLIYEGKLYMFRDDEAMAAFLSDPRRVIHEAKEHYFRLAQRQRERY